MKHITENGHTIQINRRTAPAVTEDGTPYTKELFDWDVTVPPGKVIMTGTSESIAVAEERARQFIPKEE